MEDREYTAHEAAEMLNIHLKTVTLYCRQGKLPGARLRLGSRRLGYRIPARAISALLAKGYPDAPPERLPA